LFGGHQSRSSILNTRHKPMICSKRRKLRFYSDLLHGESEPQGSRMHGGNRSLKLCRNLLGGRPATRHLLEPLAVACQITWCERRGKSRPRAGVLFYFYKFTRLYKRLGVIFVITAGTAANVLS
jgi:hypothetical protein